MLLQHAFRDRGLAHGILREDDDAVVHLDPQQVALVVGQAHPATGHFADFHNLADDLDGLSDERAGIGIEGLKADRLFGGKRFAQLVLGRDSGAEGENGGGYQQGNGFHASIIRSVCLLQACATIKKTMALTQIKSQLMSASEIDRTLVRLAHEVLEKSQDLDRLAFIGIRRRGVPLATRLAAKIAALEGREVPVGILDINLYRDDLSTVGSKPQVNATEINFSVQGKEIILMDDVLYTGRTIRAALDALFDHGRPARVQLLVLIDRGHRELPIEARYVGRTVQTADNEIIEVKFQEVDNLEKVLLCERIPD